MPASLDRPTQFAYASPYRTAKCCCRPLAWPSPPSDASLRTASLSLSDVVGFCRSWPVSGDLERPKVAHN